MTINLRNSTRISKPLRRGARQLVYWPVHNADSNPKSGSIHRHRTQPTRTSPIIHFSPDLSHILVHHLEQQDFEAVGLINQSQTCYLNTVLQMLFNINTFRKDILQLVPDNDQFQTMYFGFKCRQSSFDKIVYVTNGSDCVQVSTCVRDVAILARPFYCEQRHRAEDFWLFQRNYGHGN
jgi:ubiquitin C-terminal hydrolase